MTTQRGRHRKLRRNILHTVVATALLAGTFTFVDQTVSANNSPANAAGSIQCTSNTVLLRNATSPNAGTISAAVNAPAMDRTSPNNLVANGDFTVEPAGLSTSAYPNFYFWGESGRNNKANMTAMNTAIPSWNRSGGSPAGTASNAGTYAFWTKQLSGNPNPLLAPPSNGQSAGRVYFGNGVTSSISPANPVWNDQGYAPNTNFTITPGSGYGTETTPPEINQTVTTQVGTKYRLHWTQGTEAISGPSGIAAVTITGYGDLFFRVRPINQEYTVEFVATSTSTNIKFSNWGHITTSTEITDAIPIAGYRVVGNYVYITTVDTPSASWGSTTLIWSGLPSPLDTNNSGTAFGLVGKELKILATGLPATSYTAAPAGSVIGLWPAKSGLSAELVLDDVIMNECAVPLGPLAAPDSSSGPLNTSFTKDVIASDTPTPNATFTATTLRLCASGETSPACTATSVSVTGGVYSINGSNEVVFTPTNGWSGTAPPVTYQVTDSVNATVSSTYTHTIIPAPTATNDAQSSAWDVNQSYTPLTNDSVDSRTTMVNSSLKLCPTTATSPFTTTNCNATSVTVTGEGVYTLNTVTGVVTFNPDATFFGVAQTPIKYVFTDSLSQVASATITPTIGPKATPDTLTSFPGATATFDAITGVGGLATGASLNTSQTFLCGANETAPACTQTTVTVSGVGTYTLNQSTGVVTLVVDSAATAGTKAALTYVVKDSTGMTASSTLTPTLSTPAAVNDAQTSAWDTNQTYTPLTNGDAASSGATITNASMKLCPTNVTAPFTATNCNVTSVTVTGEGVYTLSGTTVVFDPEPTFKGTVNTPVRYIFADSSTQIASALITPTVSAPPPPTAQPDVTSGIKGATQTINLLTNTPGVDSAGISGVTLNPASVKLCGAGETSPNCNQTSVMVAGVGTYTINSSGVMTFTPDPNYTGTPAPLPYTVLDSTGQKAASTYTPTIIPPPTAVPDTTLGLPNTPQGINVVTNTAGTSDSAASQTTIAAGSVRLCAPTDTAPNCSLDNTGSVVIPNQGTYTVNPTTNVITFTPLASFVGTATPVTYSITDALGQKASTTYTPTVPPPPTAQPDTSINEQGATQWISPLGNDLPGVGAADLNVASVFLCPQGSPPPNCTATTVTVPGEGVYTVTAYGIVKFVPEPQFIGTATTINYQVADNIGQIATSQITVIVLPPPAPSANMDTGSAPYNTSVTLQPWINDAPGKKPADSTLPAPTLVNNSIRLCTTATNPPNCTATSVSTDDGTYVVNTTTGEVVFTPVNGFIGTVTSPVTYQITNNWTGTGGSKTVTSILVPTIGPPGAPAAEVDITKTKPGTSVVLVPVSNDTPGGAPLNPLTIRLCDANEISPTCTKLDVTTLDGRYVVDPTTGEVTFTPRDGFLGKATVPYVIFDTRGMKANSNLIITVEDNAVVAVPVAKKTKVGLAKTGGARPDLLLLLGILALAGAGGLRVFSRKK